MNLPDGVKGCIHCPAELAQQHHWNLDIWPWDSPVQGTDLLWDPRTREHPQTQTLAGSCHGVLSSALHPWQEVHDRIFNFCNSYFHNTDTLCFYYYKFHSHGKNQTLDNYNWSSFHLFGLSPCNYKLKFLVADALGEDSKIRCRGKLGMGYSDFL